MQSISLHIFACLFQMSIATLEIDQVLGFDGKKPKIESEKVYTFRDDEIRISVDEVKTSHTPETPQFQELLNQIKDVSDSKSKVSENKL